MNRLSNIRSLTNSHRSRAMEKEGNNLRVRKQLLQIQARHSIFDDIFEPVLLMNLLLGIASTRVDLDETRAGEHVLMPRMIPD